MKIKRNKGMTLLETIIVAFLFSIILAGIFSALAVARNSWKSGGAQLSVQQDVRKAMNAMTRELRQARLSTIAGVPADGASHGSITFQIPDSVTAGGTTWSTNIQYSLGGLYNAQILRTRDGANRVLANNISALSFSRTAAEPDMINVTVTAQKDTFPGFSAIQSSVTLNSDIKVRN